ncbi:MAG: hypothetical protein RR087_01720 [Oscillospiraceae bacterium]
MKTSNKRAPFIRILSALLATALMVGCAANPPPSTTQSGSTANGEKEPVTLNFMYIGSWGEMKEANGPIFDEIERKTGVRMTITNVDADQKQVILAGGDTTDCLMILDQTDLLPAIEGGLMLPLNELIDKLGPNLKSTYPERLKMSQSALSDGSGEAYFIPVQAGSEGSPAQPLHSMYMTRWDLYKQMNYPVVTDEDSFLAMLKEMQKLEPTTPDGKPTYGISISAIQVGLVAAAYRYTYGFYNSNDLVVTEINTGEMFYEPTDEDSPFWRSLEYYNKSFRLGLFDQDSFTQKEEDMTAKITAGQVLAPLYNGFINNYETNAMLEDPTTIKGFQSLPVEGTSYYCNTNFKGGWDACFVGIPKTCKDPEAVMRVLDYLSSYEGARLVQSGIEGKQWNYVDGVPTFTDEVRSGLLNGDQSIADIGMDAAEFSTLTGIGIGEMCPDGYPVKLALTADFQQTSNRPTDIDYCSYYNITYPMELFLNKMEEGKMFDHQNDIFDMRVVTGMGSAPEDISRYESKINDLATKSIAKLIMADSPEAFAKLKQETIAACLDAGAKETRAYWQARHDELTKEYLG